MRWPRLAALVMIFLCLTAADRPRRPIRAVAAPGAGALSFSFVSVPDGAAMIGSGSTSGSIDIGSVSRAARSRRNVVVHQRRRGLLVSTRFGIAVHDSSEVPRTASLLAALPYPIPGTNVRIGGVQIDTMPRVVANRLIPGQVNTLQLDIEIGDDVPPERAQLLNGILFTVVPE